MIGTAEDLRREADAMERLAQVLSYHRDRDRLVAKAGDFRRRAADLDRAGPGARTARPR